MQKRLIIAAKNLIRHAVYRLYRIYKDNLEYKIHIYDLQTIDIIRTLPPDAVCIDIGVNEGQIMHYLNRHCRKGKIIGIEPIKELADYNKSKYNNNRVEIKQIALSDESSESTFYYFPERNALSGLRHRDLNKTNELKPQEVKVEVKRLDDIFKEAKLDFVKIDVEGAEYNVLNGAKNILSRFHPLVVFESGRGGLEYFNHTPDELYQLLVSMGYKLSTLNNYLNKKEHFSKEEFLGNYNKGYDFEYIAHP